MDDFVKDILVAQLRAMLANSSEKELSAESLHNLRIAALRMRFALKFFGKFIHYRNLSKLRNELKAVRRVMGKTRDLDILSCRLEGNLKKLKMASPKERGIKNTVESMTSDSRKSLIKMIQSARFKILLYDLKRTIAHADDKKIKPHDLLNKVSREVNLSKKTDLHRVRISLKNLRYACEFLTDFFDKKKMKRMTNNIIHIQNILGEYHDAKKSVRILRQIKDKSLVIGRLIKIEKDCAGKAREEFKRMWGSKKTIIKYSNLRLTYE